MELLSAALRPRTEKIEKIHPEKISDACENGAF